MNYMTRPTPRRDNGLRLFEKNGCIGVCTMDGKPINGLISVKAHSEHEGITRATIEVEIFNATGELACHTGNRASNKPKE